MTRLIPTLPSIGRYAARALGLFRTKSTQTFETSANYWDNRYSSGGNSGRGSYGELAQYKADTINSFIERHSISTVIEFGCGDGNQLRLAHYKSYLGFDISPVAVDMCRQYFSNDPTKRFAQVPDYAGEMADMTMSLDVLYHLVEDKVFYDYMNLLFRASERFVAIYASNFDSPAKSDAQHVRHRRFTDWIASNQDRWHLAEHLVNPFPWNPDTNTGSLADFYFFAK